MHELAIAMTAEPHDRGFVSTELEALSAETRKLVRRGVSEDDWSGYEDSLRLAAVQLAGTKAIFDGWHDLVSKVADLVSAKLFDSFASDPRRLEAALHAMRRFCDQSVRVVAAKYLTTRSRTDRTRIAREIHDELGQRLTALKLDLGWLRHKHASKEREGVGARIHAMSGLVDEILIAVREIATKLRGPGALEDGALLSALASEARAIEARSGLRLHLSLPTAKDFPIPTGSATEIFAAFQEILTNVIRHAEAKNVHVSLAQTQDALCLEVQDDGRGITPAQADGASLGLAGVRERVLLLRGKMGVEGDLGRGTRVQITVPFEQEVRP